ncbi:MAG: hypothetical protein VXV95_00045 [Candidatus Thermoplasmatota archaeon]|nr:hypothetical protein [Candidatus Thermoplasmatota archaeon]
MNQSRSAVNMSDEPAAWPDDDDVSLAPEATAEESVPDEPNNEDSGEESTTKFDPIEEAEPADDSSGDSVEWSLPVRVAPVLLMSGEEVSEYPLNESPDGRKNTSLVLSDNLIRIIQVTYDDDGQRRLNVKVVLKNALTGFSHNHNELMHKHQWMWVTSFIVGLLASFVPFVGFFGQILLAIGIIGWVYMHLEVHTIEFSTNGSKHKVSFTGYGSNRPMFRASMALLGPTIAKYMETGEFDTASINSLHESLAAPAQPIPQLPPVVIADDPLPIESVAETQIPLQPPPPSNIPQSLPTRKIDPPSQSENLPPPPPPDRSQLPPQPDDIPASLPGNPLPPPPAPKEIPPPPPQVTTVSPPLPPPLPPATLPPPLPLNSMMTPPPPTGFDRGEMPLDAPMPEAPEVPVTAAPIEESLSDDEKNELLEELQ